MIPATLAATVVATAMATIAAIALGGRAILDGRIGDAALCLAFTLAGLTLWGAAL